MLDKTAIITISNKVIFRVEFRDTSTSTLSIMDLIVTLSITTLRISIKCHYAEFCIFLLWCWTSLCWVPLYWMSLGWMSLWWVSWRPSAGMPGDKIGRHYIQHDDTQPNYTEHNKLNCDTHEKRLSVIMLSVNILNIIMLSVIMLSDIMLSVIMLSEIMLSVIFYNCYAECQYAVSLCWVPLCWVSLCWVSLCWVSLCWVSRRHKIKRNAPLNVVTPKIISS